MFQNLLANWTRNLKWGLLAAIVVGPGIAWLGWDEAQKIRRVMADGVEVVALVDHITEKSGRRGSKSYTLTAVWQDEAGAARQADLKISDQYARAAIEGDVVNLETITVKYLPNDPEAPVVVADDAGQQLQDDQMMMQFGLGGGVVGVLGSLLFFGLGRRKPAEGADATPPSA